jgi:hypothetical protein
MIVRQPSSSVAAILPRLGGEGHVELALVRPPDADADELHPGEDPRLATEHDLDLGDELLGTVRPSAMARVRHKTSFVG